MVWLLFILRCAPLGHKSRCHVSPSCASLKKKLFVLWSEVKVHTPFPAKFGHRLASLVQSTSAATHVGSLASLVHAASQPLGSTLGRSKYEPLAGCDTGYNCHWALVRLPLLSRETESCVTPPGQYGSNDALLEV